MLCCFSSPPPSPCCVEKYYTILLYRAGCTRSLDCSVPHRAWNPIPPTFSSSALTILCITSGRSVPSGPVCRPVTAAELRLRALETGPKAGAPRNATPRRSANISASDMTARPTPARGSSGRKPMGRGVGAGECVTASAAEGNLFSRLTVPRGGGNRKEALWG